MNTTTINLEDFDEDKVDQYLNTGKYYIVSFKTPTKTPKMGTFSKIPYHTGMGIEQIPVFFASAYDSDYEYADFDHLEDIDKIAELELVC